MTKPKAQPFRPSRVGGEGPGRPGSPRLRNELREYWKKHSPATYLFPGKTKDVPLAATTIQKVCKVSTAKAGIDRKITPHTMRHSFATHLSEAGGGDLLAISRLLGHSSFSTTMKYLHVRRLHLHSVPSPADWLPVRQLPSWVAPTEGWHRPKQIRTFLRNRSPRRRTTTLRRNASRT